MGQTVSEFPSTVGEFMQSTQVFKEVVSLQYDDFLKRVGELNRISNSFSDASGTQLVFLVKRGSDTSYLWKSTVRICCIRVDPLTKQIISRRLLKLRQFLRLYNLLASHASACNELLDSGGISPGDNSETSLKQVYRPKPDDEPMARAQFSASYIFKRIDDLEGGEGTDLTECCICMERRPDITLPCTHSYCLPCIEQWNVTNKTCPICREVLLTTDDSWVISEAPDSEEVASEVRKALDNVISKANPPVS